MPERALIVKARARRDVFEISCRIEADDPSAAERFENAFREQCELILRHPFAGRACKGLRSRPLTRYRAWLVSCRVRSGAVEIERVIHGARDLRRALRG